MNTTITYHRRGGVIALRACLALIAGALLLCGSVVAQTSQTDTTAAPTTLPTPTPTPKPVPASVAADSLVARLTALRATADSATRVRIDSTIRLLVPPPNLLRFSGLRAAPDLTRGVIGGFLVTLQLNRHPVGVPTVVLTNLDTSAHMDTLKIVPMEVLDSSLVILAPKTRGTFRVNVFSDRDPRSNFIDSPHQLHIESLWFVIAIALIPLAAVMLLLVMLLRNFRDPFDDKRLGWLGLLLLEPQNHTYSLSRAQFVFWMMILAFSYMFLFIAQGLVAGIWEFPPLTGFAWTFIISLGTLITAQATTSVKGAKGSGQVHPSATDLFVHGGVVALERVQQVLWTVIAASIFVFVLIKNYASSEAMPDMPDQLLYLMGISSAGYLGGKMIRRPGPIINQVNPSSDGTMLIIQGLNLSSNAFVWVDGVQLTGNASPLARDADAAAGFSAQIQIACTAAAGWFGAPHSVVVVNSDGQRAEWDSMPAILSFTFPGAAGNTLTVMTHYVSPSASWMVDQRALPLVQVVGAPDTWTYQYPAGSVPTSVTRVTVTSSGKTVTYPSVPTNQPGQDPQPVPAPPPPPAPPVPPVLVGA